MTNIISDLVLQKEEREEFDRVLDHLINILSPENRHKLLERENLRGLNYQSSVQSICSSYEYKPINPKLNTECIHAEIFFTFKGIRDRVTIDLGGNKKKKI